MSLELTSKETQINFKMREVSEHRVYEFEDFRLEADHLLLFHHGRQLALTPKVVHTLLALIEREGGVVSKDELMQAVWPDTAVEEGNLSQNLYVLRKALGSTADGQPFIETLRRRGYRFTGDVRSTQPHFRKEDVARPLLVERSDNIYSVVDWRREKAGDRANSANRVRSGWFAPIIISVLLLLAAVGFAIFRFSSGVRTSGNSAAIPFRGKDIVRVTNSGRTKRAAISPDGRYVANVTENAEGSSLSVKQVAGTNEIRIVGPSPSEFVWAAFAPDSNYIYYLSLDRDKGDTELFRIPVLGGPPVKAADDTGPVGFSPDGTSMAFMRIDRDETRLIVAAIDGSNERVLATRREPEHFRMIWNAPAWSSDGKTIACPIRRTDENGRYETVIGINVGDGSEQRLTDGRWQQVGQPQWSEGGLVLTAAERTTGPHQIWHISTANGNPTRVTHDLNDYYNLTLTADGTRLAATQSQVVSGFWIAPEGRSDAAKMIASEVGWLDDLAWTPDSRIAYISNVGGSSEIWLMNADGSNSRQVTTGAVAGNGIAVSPDGRRIFFSSERSGRPNIWSVETDGNDLKQLTNGDGEFFPQCTPDGHWIIFQRGESETTLWRIPVGGGEAIQISTVMALRPAISPDGSMIAFHYLDSKFDRSRWSIGVVGMDGGERTMRFDLPPTVTQRSVRWSPDARSVAFANVIDGSANIWLQPVDGRRPDQITWFKSENILAFDWSPDRRTLAVIRAVETSDVVLIDDDLSR